jgi:multidrug efflux system outer membrane protein
MGYCEPGDRGGLTELSGEPPGTMARGAACAPGRAASPVRSAGIALMGSLVFALCGCASGLRAPDPKPADVVTVPPAWSGLDVVPTQAASSLARWWQRFDDPLLSTLVDLSWQANTRVRDAQGALAQARALRDVAAAALWPTLNVSASIQNGTSGVRGQSERTDATSHGAARARRGWPSPGDNLASQLQTLQLTEWRAQAGLLSALEGRAGARLPRRLRPSCPRCRPPSTQTRHALAVLTGQPPAPWPCCRAGHAGRTVPQPPATWPEPARRDPAPARRRAGGRAPGAGRLAAWPRPTRRATRASAGRLAGPEALDAGRPDQRAVASTLLASVSGPLWDGGAARAQVQAQQAALDQARRRTAAPCWRRCGRGGRAGGPARRPRTRTPCSRRPPPPPRRHAGPPALRSGLVDFQTVLDTQRNQLATQDSLATARPTSAPTRCACSRRWAAAGRPLTATGRPPRPNPVP